MITATPAKLKDGSWGARVTDPIVNVGDSIEIKTRSGKSWIADVTEIVWHGKGVYLCRTSSEKSGGAKSSIGTAGTRGRYARRNNSYDRGYCGHRCPVGGHVCTANNPCHDCE